MIDYDWTINSDNLSDVLRDFLKKISRGIENGYFEQNNIVRVSKDVLNILDNFHGDLLNLPCFKTTDDVYDYAVEHCTDILNYIISESKLKNIDPWEYIKSYDDYWESEETMLDSYTFYINASNLYTGILNEERKQIAYFLTYYVVSETIKHCLD